ncbi:MAG: hypothetical protein ABFQ95_07725 [Pseudomonadota bacterium]
MSTLRACQKTNSLVQLQYLNKSNTSPPEVKGMISPKDEIKKLGIIQKGVTTFSVVILDVAFGVPGRKANEFQTLTIQDPIFTPVNAIF